MLDTGLAGRVALVTGANPGIGAATAQALAAQGAQVFLTYLRLAGPARGRGETPRPGPARYCAQQAQSADSVVQVIVAHGGEATAWEADLADPRTVPLLFARIEATFGPVGVVQRKLSLAAMWEEGGRVS